MVIYPLDTANRLSGMTPARREKLRAQIDKERRKLLAEGEKRRFCIECGDLLPPRVKHCKCGNQDQVPGPDIQSLLELPPE